jgi:hypothetical protein
MNQSKAVLETMQKHLENAQNQVKQIEDGLSVAQSTKAEASKVKAQLQELKGNLGNSLASLSAVSGTIPVFPTMNENNVNLFGENMMIGRHGYGKSSLFDFVTTDGGVIEIKAKSVSDYGH